MPWHMKVPHKIKLFVWRACKDGLSCLLNLQKKRCKLLFGVFSVELLLRIFSMMFLFVQRCNICRTSSFLYLKHSTMFGSFLELVVWIKSRGTTTEFATFFVIAHSIQGGEIREFFNIQKRIQRQSQKGPWETSNSTLIAW